MKLLLLTSSLEQGGAETHVCALATALAARGHDVTVVSGGGQMVSRLEQAGVSHRRLPLHTHNPFRLLLALLALERLIRRDTFDLLHAHARISALLVSGIAWRRRIPFVTTVHARFRTGRWRRRLSRWGMGTVAVGEDLKQYLCEEYSVAAENVRVIPNGIDLSAFSPGERTECETLRLVFLSRLDEDCAKVAFLLCDLAPRLRERFPTLRIDLVGGGSALGALTARAREVNRVVGQEILFLPGYREDTPELLRQADVFVGVSRAALEAMACGVPVVLAGNEGFLGVADPSTIFRGELSNFCCRGEEQVSADKLYEAITTLLGEGKEERSARGAWLAAYVQETHSLEHMARLTEQFYRDMIRNSRRMAKKGEIVLCGYYGYGNTGDNALLRAACRRAERAFPGQTVCALTRRGKRDSQVFGISCIRRSSPLAIRRALRGARVLVFGGGTLLQDFTSFRSLLYYCAILRYARRQGLRIELWANGLGLSGSYWSERILKKALAGCDFVGLRDGVSWQLARELMGEADAPRLKREADLAMPTPIAEPCRVRYLLHRYGLADKPFAVVAIRGRAAAGYLRILAEWLATLPAEGIRLLFVPMFPEEDEALSRRWSREMGGILARGLCASDLVGLMKEARIVCGMRLHALVFAASAQTPFVGFGGDGKIESFCRENGGVYFTELY